MVFLYLYCTLKLFLFILAGTFLLHPGRPGEQFVKEFQVIIMLLQFLRKMVSYILRQQVCMLMFGDEYNNVRHFPEYDYSGAL